MTGDRIFDNVTATIELLARRGTLPLNTVAEELAIPRANVQRIVGGLVEAEMATIDADGSAQLSTRWLHLAESSRRQRMEWSTAHEALLDLSRSTGHSAYLIVPEEDHGLCIDWAPGHGIGVLELRPGGRLPLHAGAGGLAILAFGTQDVERYLERAPFPPLTSATLTEADDLRAMVDDIRARGYSISDEDVTVGVYSLGVPVLRDGNFVGALSLGGLKRRMLERPDALVNELLRAAHALA
ncbi:IclR family transcriptional regulator [Brachybacterium paraconglomeratum]|uniref:IclR family transcriptional regulator n=1 Tax=Brachybacterium paraconglomeratum TaxID=173362 RepID=UPI003F7BBF05